MSKSIHFNLNGIVTEAACRPDTTVLEWLRGDALLRGTKEGCAEGDCGACSVLLKHSDDEKYAPANSCIMLMGQLEGANLVTVEGLAATSPDGHPIQKLMAENGSSQCGFCTPGIVCALAGLGERIKQPSDSDIHDALAGNLCRCTGYRPIVEAARAAVLESKTELPPGETVAVAKNVGDEGCVFYIPRTLNELLVLRSKHPDATLLAGGTDISLDVAHARVRWPKTILTRHVKDLRSINVEPSHIEFGGAVSWDQALPYLHKYWPSFATLVRRFGSTQIRAMGTIAGNLANASPIGDGAPALIALGAEIVVASASGERTISLDSFFKGYRDADLKGDEIIKTIRVPKPAEHDQFRVYKISKRYDQDISTVCAAFNLSIKDNVVISARMGFGGMAATPIRCPVAEEALVGRSLVDDATAMDIGSILQSAFNPMSDMRGTARYRSDVAANLFKRLVLDLSGEPVEVMAL